MMDVERILRDTPATLTVTFYGDETAVDADGTVTCAVVNAAGTAVDSGNATKEAGTGIYSFDLAAQADVNLLTATWSGTFSGEAASIQSQAEIVGGFYFTIGELRASDTALSDTNKYTTADLVQARHDVEAEFERHCGMAFVPRFYRESIKGTGDEFVYIEKRDFATMLTVDGSAPTGTYRIDGRELEFVDDVWTKDQYYTIEYEYGLATVPVDIKRVALKRARNLLVASRARIDERATMMQIPDFGTFYLSTPGKGDALTGIPDVDVVLNQWRRGGGTVVV